MMIDVSVTTPRGTGVKSDGFTYGVEEEPESLFRTVSVGDPIDYDLVFGDPKLTIVGPVLILDEAGALCFVLIDGLEVGHSYEMAAV
jgi:hypothetical protein